MLTVAELEAIFRARDEVTPVLRQMGEGLKGMQAQLAEANKHLATMAGAQQQAKKGIEETAASVIKWGAAYATLKTAVGFVHEAMMAQAEAEASVNALNLALANQGNFSKEASASLQDYASELQRTTTFEGDATVKAMSLLAAYGLTAEEIKKATAAAADYAAVSGKDLGAAISDITRGVEGQARAFKQYGIEIDDSIPKTERLDALVGQLNTRLGGSAAAAAATYAGQVKQLQNAFGDAQEALGKFLGFMLSNGEKPFDLMLSAAQRLQVFLAQDMVIALSEFQAQWLEMMAGLAESQNIDADDSFLQMFNPARIWGNTAEQADPAASRQFAEALRQQARDTREAGDAAAQAAGHIREVVNVVGGGAQRVSEFQKAVNEMAKGFAALTVAGDQAALAIEVAALQQAFAGVNDAAGLTDEGLRKLHETMGRMEAAGMPIPTWMTDLLGEVNVEAFSTDAIEAWADALAESGDSIARFMSQASGLPEELVRIGLGMETLAEGAERAEDADYQARLDAWAAGAGARNVEAFKADFWAESAVSIADVGRALADLPELLGAIGVAADSNLGMMAARVGELGQALASGDVMGFVMSALGGLSSSSQGERAISGFALAGPIGAAAAAFDVFGFAAAAANARLELLKDDLFESLGGFQEVARAAAEAGISIDALIKARDRAAAKDAANEISLALGQQEKTTAGVGSAVDALESIAGITGDPAALGTIFQTTFWAAVEQDGMVAAFDAFQPAIEALGDRAPEILGPLAGLFEQLGNEDVRAAVDGINGLSQAFEGLSTAGYMTEQSFDAFGTSAQDAFAQATAAGLDQNAALASVAPLLANLVSASEQYGFTIDEGTQALIDQAAAAGIAFPQDPILAMTDAVHELINAIREMNGLPARDWGPPPPGVPGGGGDPGPAGGPPEPPEIYRGARADGGWMMDPGVYAFAERGPELAVPYDLAMRGGTVGGVQVGPAATTTTSSSVVFQAGAIVVHGSADPQSVVAEIARQAENPMSQLSSALTRRARAAVR